MTDNITPIDGVEDAMKTVWTMVFYDRRTNRPTDDWSMAYALVMDGLNDTNAMLKDFPNYYAQWELSMCFDESPLIEVIPYDGTIPEKIMNDPKIHEEINESLKARIEQDEYEELMDNE